MIVMIDGPMIGKFIKDTEAFNRCADERFDLIEQNLGQKVKYDESRGLDHEDCTDDDRSGAVIADREKFRAELAAAMTAVAEMIGKTPVCVVVDEGSLMSKAYEAEVERMEKEKEEVMKKTVEGKVNGYHYESRLSDDGEEEDRENGHIAGAKKMKKRRSIKFLSFCACSGKYYGENSWHNFVVLCLV